MIIISSGRYHAFEVQKSVTVQAAPGIYAGIAGIVSPAHAAVSLSNFGGGLHRVMLRGLTISRDDPGGKLGEKHGISINSVSGGPSRLEVHIEDCVISGFANSDSFGGGSRGIRGFFKMDDIAHIYIKNTLVRDCDFGIEINPHLPQQGSEGFYCPVPDFKLGRIMLLIDHSQILNNLNTGILIGRAMRVTLRDSIVSGRRITDSFRHGGPPLIGIRAATSLVIPGHCPPLPENLDEDSRAQMNIERSLVTGLGIGIQSEDGSLIRVSDSTISDNIKALDTNDGAVISRANNTVEGNLSGETFTTTFMAK